MFKIIVEHECGCFERSEFQNNTNMDSKDDALLMSLEMKDRMNNEFCTKHSFKVQEAGNDFVIAFAESTSNGCCNNGCKNH